MNAHHILTSRLELVPATYEHHCAELVSPEHLGSLLNVTVEKGWPPGEYDRSAQEFFRDKLREDNQVNAEWFCWYAIRKGEGLASSLIGAGGFIGPPNNQGEVMIGFSIMSSWRGQGYATEFVSALIARALKDSRVKIIIARTNACNAASRKVLQKNGFIQSGIVDIDGNQEFDLSR